MPRVRYRYFVEKGCPLWLFHAPGQKGVRPSANHKNHLRRAPEFSHGPPSCTRHVNKFPPTAVTMNCKEVLPHQGDECSHSPLNRVNCLSLYLFALSKICVLAGHRSESQVRQTSKARPYLNGRRRESLFVHPATTSILEADIQHQK